MGYATNRPEHNILATILVSIDVLAITLLMHASGGIRSGLGILLVVSVAAGALLVSGRTAILFAALASIAVLAQQIASKMAMDRSYREELTASNPVSELITHW